MKKYCFLLIATLIGLQSRAQTLSALFNNNRYCSISAIGQVMTLGATADSLIITFKKENVVTGQDLFKITAQETRGDYILVYIKMDPTSMVLMGPKGVTPMHQPVYGVFVFKVEGEGKRLGVLHDGRIWLTPNEARSTYAAIRLQAEYFNTWYLEERFNMFTQYPDFRDADEQTVVKIAGFWLKRIQEHRDKKLNTQNTDRFGADYGRDNLTTVLINNRLSPLATPADFNDKLKQYHLDLVPTYQLPQTPDTSPPGQKDM